MKNSSRKTDTWKIGRYCLLVLAIGLTFAAPALGFTVNVVDHARNPLPDPIGFSWLLEEDNTNLTVVAVAGDPVPFTKSISLDMHKSNAPIVASGRSTSASATIIPPDPNGRYMLSVLPDSGYTLGGINMSGDPATPLTVVVHKLSIPTAQISVLVFKDHNPINNVWDDGDFVLPGAAVTLHDAAGQQMMDGLGNPLGTVYQLDANGNPVFDLESNAIINQIGNGTILTDGDGVAVIKFLSPGKYGVVVSPPAVDPASGGEYIQTSTIEGSKVVDAWVKAEEPELFTEGFGTGFHHVFIGFVNPAELKWADPSFVPVTPNNSIRGNLRYNHFSRPPANQGFFVGPPVAECWVGLNDPVTNEGLYATPCFDGLTPSDINVGDPGSFPEAGIDTDWNGNGIFDLPAEVPSSFLIPNVPEGNYQLVTWDKPLDALFGIQNITMPATDLKLGTILSFRWFGSFLGTVFLDSDEDGFRDPDEIGLAEQNINIRFRDGTIYQAQPTDIFGGYALEEVFPFFKWLVIEVDFARFKSTGMTTAVDHGGLIPDGFAENDPWGPLPKVPTFEQLNPQLQAANNINTGNNMSRTETGEVLTQAMHLFLNQTNVVDWGKMTYTGTENGGISGVVMYAVTRAENDPRFAAGEEWEPGIPRVRMNLYQDLNDDNIIDDLDGDGLPTPADVDNYPFGNFPGSEDLDRNSNGSFDPGDAIQITTTDSWDDSLPSGCVQNLPVVHGQPIPECADAFGTWNQIRPGVFDGGYAFASYFPGGMLSGSNEVEGLPASQNYIVEAATPPGYVLLKEEDKNVDFGNEFQPSTQLLAPICVGEDHLVPPILSFQVDENGTPLPGLAFENLIGSPYSNETRPLCDRKKIGLNAKENAAADFFFFTKVPKAARAVGFVNNDLSAEFNQGSPNFGEKAAPSWIPVSFKDWKGNEVARVYADEFGGYNAMLPSTFTVNVPSPTGVSPNMLTLTLNDPVRADGSADPNYDPDYSVTSWTFHYEAGRTSYLDTPLVPVAAFVNFPQGTLDAEPRDKTPVISGGTGPDAEFGPLICTDQANGSTVTLTSKSVATIVANPAYNAITDTEPSLITRDYSFGPGEGTVLLDGVDITNLGAIISWAEESITIDTQAMSSSGGLLTVVRADNARASETGITLTITDCSVGVHFVTPGGVYPATPIQDGIDAANPGDLIMVARGTYAENVIMDKPVGLQGAGMGSTVISANPSPSDRLSAWHNEILARLTSGNDPFSPNEAPGIMVLGAAGGDFSANSSFIDGFTVTGSIAGGGIAVHTDVNGLVISNNQLTSNQGQYAGGIAIGTPDTATDANNDNIIISGNLIAKNGGITGGGGIGIYTGANDYLVQNNIIIGNFSRFSGAGINHIGVSNGTIIHNKILFNELFYGTVIPGAGSGAGINLAGEVPGGDGAGNVVVDGNQIQGNLAGSGNGGGINVSAFDGGGPGFTLDLVNNIIVNNVATLAAGGIFLNDAASATIINNTIAHNDTTATSSLAFAPGGFNSTPQPAGLVVNGPAGFAYPLLDNNIIWQNRSFYNDASYNNNMGGLVFDGYRDLAVTGTGISTDKVDITNSILTSLDGPTPGDYDTGNNYTDDPAFVHPISNQLFSAAVIDEGGNAISVRFTPLFEGAIDYHLTACSPAVDSGADNLLNTDVDGDPRVSGDIPSSFDIGADEYVDSQTDYIQLTLLSPIGGEIIAAGSIYTIAWGAPTSDITGFSLYYSLDGGALFKEIDTTVQSPLPATVRCYPWTLPEEALASQQVLIRVVALGPGADTSDSAALTIDIDALLSPNGGETLVYDALALPLNTSTINWQNNYLAADSSNQVTLEYQVDGGDWTLITDTLTGDDSSYVWMIPDENSTNALIRLMIIDTKGTPEPTDDTPILTDVSAGLFSIVPAPPILPPPPLDVPAEDQVTVIDTTPPTTGAGIFFQCPGYNPPYLDLGGTDSDVDGDGLLRADVPGEIENPNNSNQVCLHLAAGDGFVTMADGYGQYMFGFVNVTGTPDDEVMNMWDDPNPGGVLAANFPAPLIKLKQNDEVYLTLSNVGMMMRPDLFDPHTVHWHGFPQAASIFDGVPEASISINMGSSLTYYYKAAEAGTFMYHCHVEATEHMQMGMLGNLYVTPVQDDLPAGTDLNGYTHQAIDKYAYNDTDGSTRYDKEYHIQIAAFDPDFHDASENTQPLPFALMDDKYPMINGRGYPDTVDTDLISNALGHDSQRENALITVNAATDNRVLLRISSLSITSFHTITVLGLPMQVVGQGSRKYGPSNNTDRYRRTNSVTIGGGQAVDVLLDVSGVSAGETYFLYVTNLDHLSNNADDFGGMMTEIVIE